VAAKPAGGSAWHSRPNGPVEAPNPLLAERAFWSEQDPEGPHAALRAAALEIIGIALRDTRERERRLAAIGRTLLLPKEEQVGHARERALHDALGVLRDVSERF
jgi:hypothetical protein